MESLKATRIEGSSVITDNTLLFDPVISIVRRSDSESKVPKNSPDMGNGQACLLCLQEPLKKKTPISDSFFCPDALMIRCVCIYAGRTTLSVGKALRERLGEPGLVRGSSQA